MEAFHKFKQQTLPYCKATLTPAWVVAIFLITGTVFLPVGIVCLRASLSVVEIVDRYDAECVPEEFKSNKVGYVKDDSISKNCTRMIKVPRYMKAPIYVYYQLDNYYQNHRRYIKSRNDKQLKNGLMYAHTSSCQPEEFSNGLPIVPCGLIAWSLFNDSFSIIRPGSFRHLNITLPIHINRTNIAWKSDRDHKFGKDSDRDHKFGKDVYPVNFQNGSLIGGRELDPGLPLSDQEDLIVWMRTAALPSFRKLYGKIEEDIDADEVLVVHLVNNYNTYSFGGKKKLVLSTSNWLGGKNNFLGMAYVATGCFCIFIAILFALLHVKNPRPYNDPSFLLWNKKNNTI